MSKKVILTGLRANNDLHIGNYFGALLPLVDMAKTKADTYDINLFVPDLHSFTTPIDHSQLHEQIMSNVRLFAAAGLPLDKDNIRIYRQSYIPAHSELAWILDCFTGFGQMARMTQFKDKLSLGAENGKRIKQQTKDDIDAVLNTYFDSKPSKESMEKMHHVFRNLFAEVVDNRIRQNSNSSVGLFNYPVLMAADILLYGSSYVPVGDDQSQHLEFARDIAERMNSKFGELFVVPEAVKKQHEFFGKDQGLRIKDLVDPSKKMSKSDESGRGIIFLGDSPESAHKKIMGATTDSVGAVHFDYDNQPGITNLLQILALLSGRNVREVAAEWDGNTSYGDFKNAVADAVQNFLVLFQTQLSEVNDIALLAKLQHDEAAMNITANAKLLDVQRAVGLRPKA